MGYYDQAEGKILPRSPRSVRSVVANVADFISAACISVCILALAFMGPAVVVAALIGGENSAIGIVSVGVGIIVVFGGPGMLATFVWSWAKS